MAVHRIGDRAPGVLTNQPSDQPASGERGPIARDAKAAPARGAVFTDGTDLGPVARYGAPSLGDGFDAAGTAPLYQLPPPPGRGPVALDEVGFDALVLPADGAGFGRHGMDGAIAELRLEATPGFEALPTAAQQAMRVALAEGGPQILATLRAQLVRG